jgi:D-lyxose ketol-isomerase
LKRSEINQITKDAKAFLDKQQFFLPAWAYWNINEWKKNKPQTGEITNNMLGWDITDFGSGDFHSRGLFLFTLRNGKVNTGGKTYAEKVMIVEENQETPMHYHVSKMEDIINRGGGDLIIELYNSLPDGRFSNDPVHFRVDGIEQSMNAGEQVVLYPGESICLERYVYHRFYGKEGKGKVLVGEVSMVNDDTSDNYFYEKIGRFPEIIEDAEPLYLLVNDYKKFL